MSDAERALIAAEPEIDTKYVRPTPAEVLATLERIASGGNAEDDSAAGGADKEAVHDLG